MAENKIVKIFRERMMTLQTAFYGAVTYGEATGDGIVTWLAGVIATMTGMVDFAYEAAAGILAVISGYLLKLQNNMNAKAESNSGRK